MRYLAFRDDRGEWTVMDTEHKPPRVLCRCFGWLGPKNAEMIAGVLEERSVREKAVFALNDAIMKEVMAENGEDHN